jgi:hypothetical protein
MEHKCLAVPKTTVKRCKNYSINGTPFCSVHGKSKGKQSQIQLYNGSTYTFKDDFKNIEDFTPQIFLWKELNREISRNYRKGYLKKLENQAKLIRCGTLQKITNELIKTSIFSSNDDIINFFQRKNYKRTKILEDMRHFLGVTFYFQRNDHLLRKLQINVRMKIIYGNERESIVRIQKWLRYRQWLRKLSVSPKVMRKHYIPNEQKIVVAQRQIRKYITVKIKHSHDCPFSLERYMDIPEKYRVVYEYDECNSKHWRYYNVKWLNSDWKIQTDEKRYVTEPTIKHKFPEEFVEKIARKVWYLSRVENDIYLEQKSQNPYPIENDWINRFSRRSLYRFVLMILDLCHLLEIDVQNIKNWRTPLYKLKYQVFYLQVMPALRNIASNTHFHSLEEDMFYITRDMFRIEFIFPDTDISDIMAGDAIYGIIRILTRAKRQNIEVYSIIRDVIKENFQTLLMA